MACVSRLGRTFREASEFMQQLGIDPAEDGRVSCERRSDALIVGSKIYLGTHR